MSGSLGYASRLRVKDDVGGRLGDPELLDGGDTRSCPKVAELVRLIRDARHVVVHTGAGVSTSAGIPDFRGPAGVWTLQKKGLPLPTTTCPFELARPTYTHQALLALQRSGKLHFLVSCNVDCLHQRSGFPRQLLAELHGNCFAERCEACGWEAVRDFEQTTVGFKKTGRVCIHCGGRMRDQVLDWDDELPSAELELAERHSSRADLTITLGTSLQIHPACNLPMRSVKAGGKLVIINLQTTPKDKHAALVIRRRCDDVMRVVMAALQLQVPRFVRRDALLVRHVTGNASTVTGTRFVLHISSVHGPKCPVPWLQSVQLSFPDGDACVGIVSKKRKFEVEPRIAQVGSAWHSLPGLAAPWKVNCTATPTMHDGNADLRASVRVLLRLHLSHGCTAPAQEVEYMVALTLSAGEQAFTDIVTVDATCD
jgi:NAD+-dependent protein deacetylase sirtuin 6